MVNLINTEKQILIELIKDRVKAIDLRKVKLSPAVGDYRKQLLIIQDKLAGKPIQTELFTDLNAAEKKILQDNESILQEAHRIVNERVRESDRDNPVEGFIHIASIASAIRGKDITPRDASAIMMAVKLSREQFKHNRDNLVDLAGYTQIDHLLAEAGHD